MRSRLVKWPTNYDTFGHFPALISIFVLPANVRISVVRVGLVWIFAGNLNRLGLGSLVKVD